MRAETHPNESISGLSVRSAMTVLADSAGGAPRPPAQTCCASARAASTARRTFATASDTTFECGRRSSAVFLSTCSGVQGAGGAWASPACRPPRKRRIPSAILPTGPPDRLRRPCWQLCPSSSRPSPPRSAGITGAAGFHSLTTKGSRPCSPT